MQLGVGLSVVSGAIPWNPARLFADGTAGAWFDPSDLSTLFQDSAGTTPVTAAGDPVGLMLDKSGNGNDVSQATSASRPTLQQDAGGRYYLSFDGTDDYLWNSSPFMYSAGTTSAFFGVLSSAALDSRLLAEGSSSSVSPIYSPVQVDNATAGALAIYVRNDANTQLSVYDDLGSAFDGTAKVAGTIDDGGGVSGYVDGTAGGTTSYPRGTLTLDRFAIGALLRSTAGAFWSGSMYGGVVVGAAISTDNRKRLERYLAARSGVSL